MKQLLKKVFLFLLPIILLAYPADRLLSYGLRNSGVGGGDMEITNDLYTGNINTDILIIGSSRSFVHFDPAIIEEKTNMSAYVVGFNALRFNLQDLLFKEYLKYNTKPKIVICSLDQPTLYNSMGTASINFIPFMLFNESMQEDMGPYLDFSSVDYYIPFLRYVGNLGAIKWGASYYFNPPGHKMRYKGYLAQDFPWYTIPGAEGTTTYDPTIEIERDKIIPDLESHLLYKDIFIRFIQDCEQEQIKVVFVYTPEYCKDGYVVTSIRQITDYYNNIAKEYNIPFWDYTKDSISYDTQYFYNVLHLNVRGSRKFTEDLSIRLLELENKNF
ncbi:hypothetical protein [Dysgonomonas sp. 25]|uniref:hypothetical protein n=1 Tax=Dysgonomonas sp. 25 TaxID=2302933 RepID=UPI0013CF42C3|nr:hypothetical protein [Dysgonomonas sp. 25]NDV70189.1 hypothetical protein [Dysgonomonas sp. 25]